MQAQFGRYELLKRLAGGGMGEVYLARQRGLAGFQKLLVIKTLLPHLSEDEEFIAMFKDEARLCAHLVHPNICQVFEFDEIGGTHYLAMEYLRGEDLRRLERACEQRGKPLPVALICRIVADAAAGLSFAHSLRDASGHNNWTDGLDAPSVPGKPSAQLRRLFPEADDETLDAAAPFDRDEITANDAVADLRRHARPGLHGQKAHRLDVGNQVLRDKTAELVAGGDLLCGQRHARGTDIAADRRVGRHVAGR